MLYSRDALLARTVPVGSCLVWQGAKAGKGYAVVADNRERYVHRLMFTLAGNPLRKGEQAAHTCGRSDCINPDHLYRASQSDNELDKVRHGRYHHGKPGSSHCGRYLNPDLGRRSKRCRNAAGHSGQCSKTEEIP